jgi:hypothetical protein
MNMRSRKSTVVLISGLIMFSLLLGLLISHPVRADVGVRPILPGGSNIQPEGETPIQMVDEVITMDIRPATEGDNNIIQLNPDAYGLQFQPLWYNYVSEVQANFTMNNPTTEDVNLTAWFPLASALESVAWNELNPDEIVPRIAGFQVMVAGKTIEFATSELPNPKGSDRPALPWASFPVTFPAGKETDIQVNYLLPLQTSVKGSELALYYIFQTGAGWAGPIGQAELVLNLPYPASAETVTRMDPSNLNLPYFNSNPAANLPLDGVLEGNQARWTWVDFEPGPQDDFSIWLVDPTIYQQLETAREVVQASPEDGPAWLELASIYRILATKAWNYPSIFTESYLAPGLEAYQRAAEYLPEHPEPHVGIAMLSLAPYMADTNAPSEVMGSVQEHVRIARELEAAHPNLREQADISSSMLDDAMGVYFGNITATAVSGATHTAWAKETEISAMRLMPTLTSTHEAGILATVFPAKTPEPLLSTPASPSTLPSNGDSGTDLPTGTILIVEVIIFSIVGFIAYRRLLRKPG